MRYNPDTDRFIDVDAIAAQCAPARQADLPEEVDPEPSEIDKAIVAITYNLWGTSQALSRLTLSEVGEASFHSMIQDVEEVVSELRMLYTRV